jgi:hypothetical protein
MPGYGTPLGLTLPTIDGVAKESAAAPLINTALSAIIARLEGKVGAADLDINADVSFKSGAVYSGAKDLHRAAFQSQTSAITAVSNPNTVYVLSGNLHYIDGSGNLVQITSGGAVNVSTTGGITGAGYGTSGVEVNWDSVNNRYRMRSGAAADAYADVVLSDVLFNDGSGNFARLQAAAMGADYTMTLPAALPAAQSMLQLTAAGQVTASNTLASGEHLTLVGTGRVKHGTYNVVMVGGNAFGSNPASDFGVNSAAGCNIFFITSAVWMRVPLMTGKRLTAVRAAVVDNATGSTTVSIQLQSQATTGALVNIGSAATSSGAGSSQTLTLTPNQVLASNTAYQVKISISASNVCTLRRMEFDFDET